MDTQERVEAELITLAELAQRLRMHPTTVRSLWRRRIIPGLKIGHRTLRFSFQEVVEALKHQGGPASDQAKK